MRLLLIALLAFGLGAAPVAARAPLDAPVPRPRPVDAGPLIAASGLDAAVGFILLDARDGRLLASRAPDTPFMTASVIKAPTALFALDRLGPDYRFETRVRRAGDTLVLEGGGDPTLDTADLAGLAARAARGAQTPVRAFLYDDTAVPRADRLAAGQPESAGYNPAIGGLNLNYNRVLMRWRRVEKALKVETVAFAQKRTAPATTVGLVLSDDAGAPLRHETGALGERWHVDRGLFGRRPGSRWLPVRAPGAHVAGVFRGLAAESGLLLPAPQPGRAPDGAPVIARHRSEPLSSVLRGMMRYSNNLTAEVAGQTAAGGAGGPQAMADWMRALAPEVDWTGLSAPNHSGLSPAAQATPRQLATVIAAGLERHGEAFHLLLPRNPVSDPGFAPGLGLRAKTGTMNYARGLAGVMESAGGRRAIFVILICDMSARAAFDAAFDPLTISDPPAARRWLRRARRLEGALLHMLARQMGD